MNLDELQAATLQDTAVAKSIKELRERNAATDEIYSLAQKQETLGYELTGLVDGYELGLQQGRKENHRQRRQYAEGVIASDEFQGFIRLLRGLYFAGNYKSFDELVATAIPAHCSRTDSETIAHSLSMIIDEPTLPDEVEQAKTAIALNYPGRRYFETMSAGITTL